MNPQLKQELKRWALSSLVTFISGFSFVFVAGIEDVTLESFKDGSIVGFAFVCVRAGIKAVLEAFLLWRSRKAVDAL